MKYPIRFYLEAEVEVEAASADEAVELVKDLTPGEILVQAVAPVTWHECLVGDEDSE